MDCTEDSLCLSHTFPSFLPPPPLPSFLIEDVEAFLNQTRGHVSSQIDSEGVCDLCTWSGASAVYGEADNSLALSSLLVIVAIVSALCGAGLTSLAIMIRRLRNRKFESGSDSVRHLSRKMNESSRPTPSASSFSSNVLTENTYCEGPYNDKEVSASTNNIYAELHSTATGMWTRTVNTRPPIPPPNQNCYLELNPIPNTASRCARCLPAVPVVPQNHQWQATACNTQPSSSSSYYSDLDLARHSAQPV